MSVSALPPPQPQTPPEIIVSQAPTDDAIELEETTSPTSSRLTEEEAKLPTMAIVLKKLEEHGLDYTAVTQFRHSLPEEKYKIPGREEQRRIRLDTYTNKDGVLCFKGNMTFMIEVIKNGKPLKIYFQQPITTTVPVPLTGDVRATKDAKMNALFKLNGYRKFIEEPLLNKQDKQIQKLAKQSFFMIKTVRQEKENSFYGKRIRWESKQVKGCAAKVAEAFNFYSGSIVDVEIEGKRMGLSQRSGFETFFQGPQPYQHPLWRKEITCPDLENRDDALEQISQNLKQSQDPARKAHIEKSLASLAAQKVDFNAVVNIFTHNIFHVMNDLDFRLSSKAVSKCTEIDCEGKIHEINRVKAHIEEVKKLFSMHSADLSDDSRNAHQRGFDALDRVYKNYFYRRMNKLPEQKDKLAKARLEEEAKKPTPVGPQAPSKPPGAASITIKPAPPPPPPPPIQITT